MAADVTGVEMQRMQTKGSLASENGTTTGQEKINLADGWVGKSQSFFLFIQHSKGSRWYGYLYQNWKARINLP